VFYRQLHLFVSDDFHTLMSDDGGSVLPAKRTCREQIPQQLNGVYKSL
jgi:hypothetical protein